MNLKKELGSVADAVTKVMEAELSSKQKAIAKLAEPKEKIDSGDLAKLRAGHKPVKEHSDDDTDKYGSDKPGNNESAGPKYGVRKMKKEEVEQIDEAGYSAKEARAGKDIGKPGKMFAKIAASAAKKYGSEERGKKVAGAVLKKLRMKEDVDHDITDEETEELLNAYEEAPKTFSEMMAAYKENGLALFAEEPTEEQFNKEIKDQTDSFTGKKKQPGVSSPATAGTKSMKEETHTKVEVIDFTDVNGVKVSTIDLEERTLTEPETKKKEEVVKSMKKKMPGFKERYGERAKSVMYATATKIAKEKA